MAENVTREEFDKLERKFENLVAMLENCDIKMKPDFYSVTQDSEDIDFNDDLDLSEDQDVESKVGSNEEEPGMEF